MTCKEIQNDTCTLTDCLNPQPDYCAYVCPKDHDHAGLKPHEFYAWKKYGIKPGEKKQNKITNIYKGAIHSEEYNSNKVLVACIKQFLSNWCILCAQKYKQCEAYNYTTNRHTWCFCGKDKKQDIIDLCPQGKFSTIYDIAERVVKSAE